MCMMILLTVLLTVGLIATAPSLASPQAVPRHSGTVASVDPVTRTLVLEELAENGRPRQLQVRVPEGASVVLSERIPDDQVTRLEAPFNERPIEMTEMHAGDFVVVEGATQGDAAVASTVVVTLRPSDAHATPAASPGPRSRP